MLFRSKLVFGIVVVGLGTELLSRELGKSRLRSSRPVLAIIGIAAGILCGLFGVGALLAAYVSRVTESDSAFKANISAVFIADNTFRAILYTALGLLSIDTLKTVLLLIPFGLAGLFAGIRCSGRVNERIIRMLTAALLVQIGRAHV